eukprot:1613735-Pyramimonas_sp.AAC.1
MIEGGRFSSRLSTAHIRFLNLHELHGLRAAPFQNVVCVLAARTFVSKIARGSRIPMISTPETALWKD